MSWVNNPDGSTNQSSSHDDDWLYEDTGNGNTVEEFDPIENLRKKFETLGQNEGLEHGMRVGEEKGFAAGFSSEAPRAFALGRTLGAAKTVLKLSQSNLSPQQKGSLSLAVQEAELSAKEHWVSSPRRVDDALTRVREELSTIGITLSEWKEN